jgi:uncharacterized protein YjbJ (UPF0337 family)
MNSDQFKGQWKQIEGLAKRTWGKLTDDDWAVVAGDLDLLTGRIQERYGDGKEVVLAELGKLYKSVTEAAETATSVAVRA